MQKILYGNFEFEHELESPTFRPTARIVEMSAQLSPHLLALARDGDFVWSLVEIPKSFLAAAASAGLPKVSCLWPDKDAVVSAEPTEIVPWGFSGAVASFADRHSLIPVGCQSEVVRQVNDRAFAFELETVLDSGLPGRAMVRSHEEFQEAVRAGAEQAHVPESQFRWVAKSRFGMASRGRILGTGTQIDDPSAGWLWKQFEKNGCVIFEPWVECDREFSTQWDIPRNGGAVLRGWTEIQNERAGTPSSWLRHTGVPFEESEFRSAFTILKAAVERVASAGYFGPLGIDSMRFRGPDSSTALRPLQDINARYTMGRVALELAEKLSPDLDAVWVHVPSRQLAEILEVATSQDALKLYSERGLEISAALRNAFRKTSQTSLPDDTQVWLTSPLWLEDVLTNRCGLLISSHKAAEVAGFFRSRVLPGGNITRSSGHRT